MSNTVATFPPAKVGGLIEARSLFYGSLHNLDGFRRQKSAASLKLLSWPRRTES